MRPALSIALLPLLALGLAACGDDDSKGSDSAGDDKSSGSSQTSNYEDTPVDQIGEDVEAAMKALETVHLAGNIVDDEGQKILMDVTVSRGGDCEGTMQIEGVGSMDIIAVEGVSYFKADDAFWKSQGGEQASVITGLIGDKWTTDSSDPEGFAELCDLDELLSDLNSDDIAGDDSKVTGTQDVSGKETVTIAFTSDDGNQGTAYVAAEDPHYFVRFDVPEEGAMGFSRFDEPLEVEKPAAGEIFDLAKLN
ncbi:hypothetical protein CFH99_22415 [Nocardioides aromaticivorans]|uniref:Lipoprotein n=1 Tax=Nocardioides aromaticivorans TaxID=200618 RepID=A0ABX7PRS8_9ACTN|nr:hypothetical protein [Nocardioides aromaticivorans]QSR28382.1 hypothetical protein CFH99_22415 [Nocardioides aromaticivorans]